MSFDKHPLLAVIRERFYYDNGVVRIKKSGQWKGKLHEVAGHLQSNKRRTIQVKYKTLFVHHVVWLLHFDQLPSTTLDHIDRNPENNLIENLRIATGSEQQGNKTLQRNNTSGFRGVSLKKAVIKKPWSAHIKEGKISKSLGYFSTPEEAALAYDLAAFQKFGEFASLNFPQGHSHGI